ncbi:hypothetical protein PF005_g10087 [Phytophthora fragariae]|uniref:Uncharacterized protein n=1 Tax=Phytophthora fragariae TaxID=53985 RepID=A0A6A3L304_9STRA|nr:hypothetical protein PF003_g12004 [Phytophthora fragariae]KAE9012318.1 hypothetical protein PF011_g8971 [Phytophthora fragariae]KAE9114140.1 hypothetical protein PF010_g9809 [Phytophthora fragariae]KAE9145821.1 hypothetical protein PF006_g9363 [Phytophthora fragariae]KAE9213770.1 hypothetical protein PF005_g10087 [Phytophthora fragariae]
MNDASTPELQHRTDMSSPQNERLCKYSGTRCANVRSLKRNGELHNLCEFHRERANANQSRFDARQRQQRQLGLSSSEAADLPEPIPVSVNSPDPPLDEWEADLLLETMQDS